MNTDKCCQGGDRIYKIDRIWWIDDLQGTGKEDGGYGRATERRAHAKTKRNRRWTRMNADGVRWMAGR